MSASFTRCGWRPGMGHLRVVPQPLIPASAGPARRRGRRRPGPVVRRTTVSENEARHLGPRYTSVTCPMGSSTPSSENCSPTCSMNSVPTHRPSSTRGRRAISLRTSYCASTTTSRHQGSSCPVRGAASPNDDEPHSRVKTSAGSLQRSDPDRHQVSSASVGCGAWPTSTSSSSTTRTCAEPTVVLPGRTRPRWMRRYGATSVARHGSSLGDYAAQGSNSSGRGRPTPYEPGAGNPRFASLDLRASCCSICSVVSTRHESRSADPPTPSTPSGVPGSACKGGARR